MIFITSNIVCGVPQGSVLWQNPLILDPGFLNRSFFQTTQIFDVRRMMCSSCYWRSKANYKKKILVWDIEINKLWLNLSKTKFMIFSDCLMKLKVSLEMYSDTLEKVYQISWGFVWSQAKLETLNMCKTKHWYTCQNWAFFKNQKSLLILCLLISALGKYIQ